MVLQLIGTEICPRLGYVPRLSYCSPEAGAAITRSKVACAPTQSPAMIAGLRRIATSLWLRFVASPQRMPIFRYRRWGRPVVNFIYKVPPRRRFLQHRLYLAATNWGSTRLHGV